MLELFGAENMKHGNSHNLSHNNNYAPNIGYNGQTGN